MAWIEQSGANTWRVRYRRPGNTTGSINGFPSKRAAQDHADNTETDQRRGTWIDPAAGHTTLDEWIVDWLDALDVDTRTEDNYRSMLRNHIQPRWGSTALADIKNLQVQSWAKQLRATPRAPVTVAGIMKLFSMLITDAVDEKLIAANPIRPRRRGRRRHTERLREQVWAEPDEVLRLADQIASHYGPGGAVLVVTAAWSGARWGELTGLQRPNVHLFDDDTGYIYVDPAVGALHESCAGRLWLGPPKTADSARTITLPPFLVRLLRAHLETHDRRHVFTSPDGELHRRSNFSRRAMRPAADGTTQETTSGMCLHPVKPGLTFHGLRHSNKTWMIADNIPEIAQCLRLGHVLKDKVQQTYSHVASEVEHRVLERLQHRWDNAVDNATTEFNSSWRAHARLGGLSSASAAA